LTTPTAAGCRKQTPLNSTTNATSKTLRGDLSFRSTGESPSAAKSSSAGMNTPERPALMVVAATSDADVLDGVGLAGCPV
jgi:hypothetical protein